MVELTLSIPIRHTLTDEQAEDIALRLIDGIVKGRWVRDDKVWEEVHTSHSFDIEVNVTSEELELIRTANAFRSALIMRRRRIRDGGRNVTG